MKYFIAFLTIVNTLAIVISVVYFEFFPTDSMHFLARILLGILIVNFGVLLYRSYEIGRLKKKFEEASSIHQISGQVYSQ